MNLFPVNKNCIDAIRRFFDIERLGWTSLDLILDKVSKAIEGDKIDSDLLKESVLDSLKMVYQSCMRCNEHKIDFNLKNYEWYEEICLNEYDIARLSSESKILKTDLWVFYYLEYHSVTFHFSLDNLLRRALRIIITMALLIDTSPIYMLELGCSQDKNMSNYEIITSMLGYKFIDEFKKSSVYEDYKKASIIFF